MLLFEKPLGGSLFKNMGGVLIKVGGAVFHITPTNNRFS